jgi:hypothetical protein
MAEPSLPHNECKAEQRLRPAERTIFFFLAGLAMIPETGINITKYHLVLVGSIRIDPVLILSEKFAKYLA